MLNSEDRYFKQWLSLMKYEFNMFSNFKSDVIHVIQKPLVPLNNKILPHSQTKWFTGVKIFYFCLKGYTPLTDFHDDLVKYWL